MDRESQCRILQQTRVVILALEACAPRPLHRGLAPSSSRSSLKARLTPHLIVAQENVVNFCSGFRQLKSMGFAPPHIVGALALHSDDIAAATEACLSCQS